MSPALKKNICLAVVGSLVGVGLGVVAGYGLLHMGMFERVLPEGAVFESPEHFRRTLLERDERDTSSTWGVSLRSIIQPHESDIVLYTLLPNLDVKFQGKRLTTNSFGMRGPEIELEKPANVFRLALLGDSFAFGWGVDEAATFARTMEVALNEKLPAGKRVEVLNFGTPGYSTFQEVAYLVEEGLKFEPDAVLVFFVENDFNMPFFFKNFNDPSKLEHAERFDVVRKQANGEEAVARRIALKTSVDPNQAIWRLADTVVKHKLPAFIAFNPKVNVEKEVKKLWALPQRKEIQRVRVHDEFHRRVQERGLTGKQLMLPGDPHPNEIWHEIIGELLAEKLYPTVAEATY